LFARFFWKGAIAKSCFLDKFSLAVFRKNEHSLVAIELFTTTKTPPSTGRKKWNLWNVFLRSEVGGVAAIEQPR
jgi:hypothetical protein